MNVTGFRCAACGAEVDVATPYPWRCPHATDADRHHVLHRVRRLAPFRPVEHPNPFVAFDSELAWAAFADAHGMDADARAALVAELHDAVAAVAGTGFGITPFARADALSDALGFELDGGVWVKDETGNVAGSHKARHLATVLLHLLAAERLGLGPATRAPLAIASCGNAALAAATLAAAVGWPLEVFVPPGAHPNVLATLTNLGATITFCPRQPGDPPGDPCLVSFRQAVTAGAVPFAVQGPENALCLDGGRTLGWEVVEAMGASLDRVFVQVGGGALASCVALACADDGIHPRLHAVQTSGCAPLERAWHRALEGGGVAGAGRRWAECMQPWEVEPRSAATGILDDETYDWLGIVAGMASSGGSPIVVDEAQVARANQLAAAHTSIDADETGTAGLAGLLAATPSARTDERIAVVFTGRRH
jgi:threonine dehydratase